MKDAAVASKLTTVLELAALHPETVSERLTEQAARIPDRVLLVTPERSVTFGEMESAANRVARGFEDIGVGKGDAVCQLLPNCDAIIVNWMALAKLGAINAPLNYQFHGAALARVINITQARVLVLDQQFESSVVEIIDELEHLELIIYRTDNADFAPSPALSQFEHRYLVDLQQAQGSPDPVNVHYSDPLMLLFTSGTTGPSKAVEISHRYALSVAAEYIEHWRMNDDDVFYCPYPLYHIDASFATFLNALHRGGKAVIVPKFSVTTFWDEMREYGVTHTIFMGAVATFLFNQPARPDDLDNPLRLVMMGPMPGFWRAFEERFGLKAVGAYGGTELNMICWANLDEPHIDDTYGLPCEHFELCIGDELDELQPAGVSGEILIRPKRPFTMMTAYYRNAPATARALRNLWHHTGDRGYLDDDGYLHFVGRMKDSIRRRGENISAFEVEEVLDQHHDVVESAVFGVPSEYTEEEVKAVIVLRTECQHAPADLVNWATGRLPRYALPRYVEFVADLPHTDTDKVQKDELRTNWRNTNTYDAETGAYIAN
jgi:crotonobetaine/carnitine-CoA ligase